MDFRTPPPSISAPPRTAVPCPVCAEQSRSYLFVVRGLPVARCPGCGLVLLDPPPAVADFPRFYRDLPAGADPAMFYLDDDSLRDAAARQIGLLRQRGLKGGRMLIIGPVDHPFGQVAETFGFEVKERLTVRDLEEGGHVLVTEAFHVVVVLHHLEKSQDPRGLLARLWDVLLPGGTLLVMTPSIDSWMVRRLGGNWTEWRPENRYYFGRSTLHSLLLSSGFAQVWMEPDRRLYTLRHLYERSRTLPRTSLTVIVGILYRLALGKLKNWPLRISSSGIVVTAVKGAKPAGKPLLSIVVPAFNEKATIRELLDAVLATSWPEVDREVIVVESNSSDGTREIVQEYAEHPEVRVLLQERPRGKGNAVREGLAAARGDIAVIQDADLEYDLADYPALLQPLLRGQCVFVLGSRHSGTWKMRSFADQEGLATYLNFGHILFTTLVNVALGTHLKDPFTMYKVFRRDCLYGLKFTANRFDFDYELVMKLVRKGYVPPEIPVNYRSRSFKEGKKVSLWRDPVSWLRAILKFRLEKLEYNGDSSAAEKAPGP
jgi:hypothetical protein